MSDLLDLYWRDQELQDIEKAQREADTSSARRALSTGARGLVRGAAQAVEELTGSETARNVRQQQEANIAGLRAGSSFVQEMDQIEGIGDAASYLTGQAIESIPSIALMGAGGLAVGLGARALGTAASFGARAAGGVAATTLPAIGDKFQAQREEVGLGGEVNKTAASGLGIIDATMNLVGIERLGLGIPKSMLKGRGARAALGATLGAGGEGLAEAGQQFTEELARRAVNEEFDVVGPEARKRILQAGVTGAALGGAFGGVAGAVSRPYVPPAQPTSEPELQGPPERQGAPEAYGPQLPEKAIPSRRMLREDVPVQQYAPDMIALEVQGEGGASQALTKELSATLTQMVSDGDVQAAGVRIEQLAKRVRKNKPEDSDAVARAYKLVEQFVSDSDFKPGMRARGDATIDQSQFARPPGQDIYREPDTNPGGLMEGRGQPAPEAEAVPAAQQGTPQPFDIDVENQRLVPNVAGLRARLDTISTLPAMQKGQVSKAVAKTITDGKVPEALVSLRSRPTRTPYQEAQLKLLQEYEQSLQVFAENPVQEQASAAELGFADPQAQMVEDIAADMERQQANAEQIALTQQAARDQAVSRESEFRSKLLETTLMGDSGGNTYTKMLGVLKQQADRLPLTGTDLTPEEEARVMQHMQNRELAAQIEKGGPEVEGPTAPTTALKQTEMFPARQMQPTGDTRARRFEAEATRRRETFPAEPAAAPEPKLAQREMFTPTGKVSAEGLGITPDQVLRSLTERLNRSFTSATRNARAEVQLRTALAQLKELATEQPKLVKQIKELQQRAERADPRILAEIAKLREGGKVEPQTAPTPTPEPAVAQTAESKAAEQRFQAEQKAREALEKTKDTARGDLLNRVASGALRPDVANFLRNSLEEARTPEKVAEVTKAIETASVFEPKSPPARSTATPEEAALRAMTPAQQFAEKRRRVEGYIRELTQGWTNAPEIVVVDPNNPDPDTDPQVAEMFRTQEDTRGAYFPLGDGTGIVAINLDWATNPAEVKSIVIHESLSHYGLEQAFGAERANRMLDAYRRSPELRADTKALMNADPAQVALVRSIHQHPARVLAYFAEEALIRRFDKEGDLSGVYAPLWKRVKEWLLQFLSKRMNAPIGTQMTEADLRALLAYAHRAVTQGRRTTARTGVRGAPDTRTAARSTANPTVNPVPEARQETDTRQKTWYQVVQAMERKGYPDMVVRAAYTANELARRGLQAMMFGRDLVDYAVSKGLTKVQDYNNIALQIQTTANESNKQLDALLVRANSLGSTNVAMLNDYLKKTTIAGKWGYDPQLPGLTVQIDPKAQAAHAALRAKAPEVADAAEAIFAFGYKSRKALQDATTRYIEATSDAEIAAATTPADKQEATKRKQSRVTFYNKTVPQLPGPYAPLSRFGDYITIAKSPEYLKYESMKDRSPADNERLNELRANPDHFAVLFRDTLGKAEMLRKELQGKDVFKGGQVVAGRRTENFAQLGASPLFQMQKLVGMVNDSATDTLSRKEARAIEQFTRDLYITSLSEMSARKHDLRRENIEGADDDMLRALSSKGRADAYFMAQLVNRDKLNDSLKALIDQADDRDDPQFAERKSVLNEILARHISAMEIDSTPLQDKVTALSSFYFLATSPRYYMMNALQPALYTVPILAGRYGYGQAWGAMNSAYKAFGDKAFTAGFWRGEFNVDSLSISADEKAMLRRNQELGLLDLGMSYEAGFWEATGTISKHAQKVNHFFRSKSQQLEVINRSTTALAAYRLAKERGQSHDAATQYATDMINQTQFDYSRSNAPRALNMLPKYMTQFRKYQLGQIALMGRLLANAKNELRDRSPEETYASTKALGLLFAQLGTVAGVAGLPAAQLVGVLGSALFGGDDEPINGERWLNQMFGEGMGQYILRGVPLMAGVELNALGMGTMLNPFPFFDYTSLNTRAGLGDAALTVLGPVAGMAAKEVDGATKLRQGDVLGAMQLMMPKGIADSLKAYDYTMNGVSKRNGDMLLSPAEISSTESLLQLLGFQPAELALKNRLQGELIQYEKYFQGRTSQLKNAYATARKSGDGTAMREIELMWKGVQDAKERVGFKRTPNSDLLKASTAQAKREKQTYRGVQYTPANEKFVKGLAQ